LFATRTRILVAALIGSAAMVAGTSSASAAITSLSVNDRASVQLDGAVAVVTGFVQCTAGDTVDVSTTVIQGKGQLFIEGFGDSGAITCTGSLQAWTIVASLVIGSAYKHGQASSLTQAFDSTDFTSADSVSQTLHMGN
jgi:formylmethanofuran dehydrogenase subunit E